VGIGAEGSIADIEILESWFPLLFTERRARPGSGGAGVHRAGGGTQLSFRPHGVDQVNGTMFGMRRWLPLQGLAGGSPGACNEFLVHHRDGSTDELDPNSAGTPMVDGDSFEMRLGSGGGFGDPLDREPALVAADVASGRFSTDDADRIYGIALAADGSVDPAATATRRDAIRADRLARANPPLRSHGERQAPSAPDAPAFPLYPGVVQQGNLAFAEATGRVLAEAPAHWTDGCPVLEERRWPADGPDVVFRTYLDPASGRALHVEVALADGPRSFEVNPRRWTKAD
jgi:N-methylhydantoinase B